MKKMLMFTLLLGMLLAQATRADTTKDFVRIACVPEAGLFDLEFRTLYDSVAGGAGDQDKRTAALAQAGFRDPHGLAFSCALGGVVYSVSAQQDPTSERMCGGEPEVYVTVKRDGATLLSNVVFGESCHGLPSLTHFTVGDGPNSWRGRETHVCYATGKDTDPPLCDWTFGGQAAFDKKFPVDAQRLESIATAKRVH